MSTINNPSGKVLKLLNIVFLNIISLVWICEPSLASPQTNSDGDYIFPNLERRGEVRQLDWVVTDEDPSGLNCRMPQQYRGMSMDSIDTPRILYQHNYHTISEWPVMATFKTGEKLQAVTNNFGNNVVLIDKQGKPWIPVNTNQGNCFVRANRQFIEPISGQ